ncbi:MAG: TRAP transporter substrate-binding protein DctP [Proteobacteria bacterium]|nr:TRAP transporter substrate-binding protein DctP [Pseudomonadota bacterium]
MKKVIKAAAAASVFAFAASAADAQEYVFKTATIAPLTEVYNEDLALPFAKYVEVLTDGKVKFEIFDGGVLSPIFKIFEAVQDGVADAGISTPLFLGTKDPYNAMALAFPTGLGTDSLIPWVYFGGGGELLTEHRRETMNLHSIPLGVGPSEIFAHSHVKITKVEDLKNLKYRTLGNWAAVVEEAFGASPTVFPGGEVYGALEKKQLDLAEYSMPSQNFALGLPEVAPYIIYPGIHAPAWGFELIMQKDRWDALPEDIRQKIEIAAKLTTWETMARIQLKDMKTLAEFKGDNEFVALDEEFKEKSRVAARAWGVKAAAASKAEGNDFAERAFKSITEFQDFWRAHSGYMVVDHTDNIR